MVYVHGKNDNSSIHLKNIINSTYMKILMCVTVFIVQFIFGRDYYKNSYKEIFKWRTLGMNTLISSLTIVSFIYSCVNDFKICRSF